MQILPTAPPTPAGEPMFTGHAWFTYHSGDGPLACAKIHFAPGARSAWHSHANGQILYILEGVARIQERGGTYQDLLPGQTALCPAGVEHWHGAAPGHFMTHLAIHDGPVTWAEPVTETDYHHGQAT